MIFHEAAKEDAAQILDDLDVIDNKWVFKNYDTAKKFSLLYKRLNEVFWAGFNTAIMFKAVGEYLRYALEKQYIAPSDLYTTDDEVLATIKQHHAKDSMANKLYERMNNQKGYKNDPKDFDKKLYCKSRAVDPWCMTNNSMKRMSEIDPSWADVVSQENKPKLYFIKYIG